MDVTSAPSHIFVINSSDEDGNPVIVVSKDNDGAYNNQTWRSTTTITSGSIENGSTPM